MKIQSLSYHINSHESNYKIYISKEVYNKAKEIKSQGKEALVYDNKVLALNKETISELSDSFRGDIKSWNGIYFATGKAKNYVEKISDFVLNDLGVKEADKNRDGIISPKEKIETKSMLYNNQLVKPAYVLSTDELLEFIKHQKSESIDEIIDENIQIDKNRDGKVDTKELKNFFKSKGKGGELSKLYRKLSEIEAKIRQLSKNKENMQLVNSLLQEKGRIIEEIKKILEESMRKHWNTERK